MPPPVVQSENYTAPLPLRPCVGVVLFNAQGLVWVGRHRPRWAAQRESYVGDAVWQLPQGGIEPREPSREAAFRELREETGVRSATLIGEIPGWLTYELPAELLGIALKGKYAGHRLRWYAMRFEGDDSEIDIVNPPAGEREFAEWRWGAMAELPDLIIPFKRPVYEKVVAAFRHLGA
jgi:putative (di)nucleoside polyphosphate hydrolase